MVADGQLSTGHAKALASMPGTAAINLAREIVAHGLSVRAVEEKARGPGLSDRKRKDAAAVPPARADSAAVAIENAFRKRLQTDVQLSATADGKGSLKIQFYSHEDLERLMDIIIPDFRDT
jgi:ParB family chromosome partitioning protein